ncbi:1-acyl-sn-glycerol-3-phosphate acyltransferase alpha [Taenia solium]|eukprot:TsM_000786400 transcript=TsM_000786400 gene=TsM_000786400
MYWQLAIGFVLLIIIIPSTRARVHYFAAYFIYASVVFIGSVVYAFKFILKGGPRYENSWLARTLMGLQPRIFGLETYDPDQQYIYVANHQSFIDVLYIWKLPSTVIAKDTLKYFGPLGAILYYTKSILIHRSNHEKAISEMNRAAEQIMNDKVSLFVFPEGTRNISGHLLPFKKGAFHLAIQTHLPIQPVVISCYNSFLDHKRFSLTPAPYGIYLLPPISTIGMDKSQVNELVERTYLAMSKVFDWTVHANPEELGKDLRKKSD